MFANKLLFFSILILWNTNLVFAQPAQYWIKYFTNGELDYTRDLAKDNNGNYIVTGTSVVSYPGFSNYGVVTVKYDSLGNQSWIKTKDNPNSIEDDPFQILLDDSNNVYIFGIMAGKFFLLKYDELGNEKWYEEFSSLSNYYELTDRACIDGEGNIYCAGASEVNGRLQSFVRKYSSNGNLLWHKGFDSLSTVADYPASIIFDSRDHLFLTGCSIATDTTSYHYILKLDQDGNMSWRTLLGTDTTRSFKEQIKLIISSDMELYLLGTSSSIHSAYGRDIEIIKIDSSGNKIWENHVSGYPDYDDFPRDIIVDNNKGVYVTGSISVFYPPNMISNLFTTAKFSDTGDSLWSKILGQEGNYPGVGIVLNTDENNDLYVAGGLSSEPFVAGNYDMMILKYNSDGDTIWTLRRNIYNIDDTPADLLLNATDDFTIILTGALRYVTIRYSDNIVDVTSESPIDKFELRQNYPNPFNPNTTINYSIPEASNVKIELYDILGNKIQLLVNEYKSAGKHSVEFNGSQLSSGIYLYRLITDNFIQSRKMMLLK
jgi:hypothetical protein